MHLTRSHLMPWQPPRWWWVVPPSRPTFHRLYLRNWEKVQGVSVMPSVTSHWATPRDIIVSAPVYGPCSIRLILEATRSFAEKGPSNEVSTPTTPDTTAVGPYVCPYIWANYRAIRKDSCKGMHAPSSPSTHCRATQVWRPRVDLRPRPYWSLL